MNIILLTLAIALIIVQTSNILFTGALTFVSSVFFCLVGERIFKTTITLFECLILFVIFKINL